MGPRSKARRPPASGPGFPVRPCRRPLPAGAGRSSSLPPGAPAPPQACAFVSRAAPTGWRCRSPARAGPREANRPGRGRLRTPRPEGGAVGTEDLKDAFSGELREEFPIVPRQAEEPEFPLVLQGQGVLEKPRRRPVVPAQEQDLRRFQIRLG